MRRFALVGLLLCSLAVPGAAAAAYDPVADGTTTIVFSRAFRSLLDDHRVRVQAKGGARINGARLTLPAGGGEIDPRKQAATIESAGTIVFVAGRRKVLLRAVAFQAKHAPLFAKVGGGQLKLVTAGALRAKRQGFGCSFAVSDIRLTAKFAQRLNKKLRLGQVLAAGQRVGKLTVTAQPETVHLLPTGRLALALDPSFHAKLNNRFVSVNPVAPAELAAGPVLSFPVGLESTLAPDGLGGVVKLGGSVELLQLGNVQYFWRELLLAPALASFTSETDLQPSPPQPGRSAAAPIFNIGSGGQVEADAAARKIVLRGQVAGLAPSTAAALNAAFAEGRPLFAAGEVVGTISAEVTAE